MRGRFLFAIVVLVLGSPAAASEPIPGSWNSTPAGASLHAGRAAVSWSQALDAARGLGDALNAQSWLGSGLGTERRFTCARSEREQVLSDELRLDGSGALVITTLFTGGRFALSKDGPWATACKTCAGGWTP